MVEGVLFDLFGTLIEYEAGRGGQDFGAFCSVARDLGIHGTDTDILSRSDTSFAQHEKSAADSLIEFSMADSMSTFAQQSGVAPDTDSVTPLVESYITCWMQSVRPLAGIDRLVGRVAKNHRVGLISNTHYRPLVDRLLQSVNLYDLFEHVTTSVEHGYRKPHPNIFTDTLDVMGLAPVDAVYVGDNYLDDYRGSGDAGMSCFLIGRHARVPLNRQLRTIFDLPLDLDRVLAR